MARGRPRKYSAAILLATTIMTAYRLAMFSGIVITIATMIATAVAAAASERIICQDS